MRRLIVTASAVVIAAGLAVPYAQQSGTLVLRSGSTVAGELVDLGGSGFTFRVNGQDREIPRHEVAAIDFGGSSMDVPAEARDLPAGANLVQLRSGEIVQGEFYDVSGTQPLRIVFRTGGGERVFQGHDVRRIFMVRASDTAVTPVAPAPEPGGTTVVVSSRTAWTSTGINVRRGQQVRFEASGEVTFSPRGHVARPAGSVDNLFDSNAPVPTALQGSLVGRVGSGSAARGRSAGAAGAFAIGSQSTVTMPADGVLFLGVNDSGLNDNRGEFSVTIRQ